MRPMHTSGPGDVPPARRGTYEISGTDPARHTPARLAYFIPCTGSPEGRGAGAEEAGLPEAGVVVDGGFRPVRPFSADRGGGSLACSQAS